MRDFVVCRAGAVALALCAILVRAAPTSAQTMADVAALSGPDRMEKIIAGAKKENTLTLYSSATTEDMGPIVASFETAYGVRVRTWRGSSEDIRQRGITEARAGRYDADIFETAGTELEPMQREGVMQEMKSPTLADLAPQALRPHREWVASRISAYVAAYNTNLVRKEDAPKNYEDLADVRWKGKLGVEAEDAGWFMTLASVMGAEKAEALFRRIVRTNGISVRKGHTLLANLVVSGEVPLALTLYGYKAGQLEAQGAPLARLALAPSIAQTTGISLARKAPHPHAAALFWEHYLTEGQKILVAQHNSPVNMKVKPFPADLVLLDPARFIDEGDRWQKLFREIFINQSR